MIELVCSVNWLITLAGVNSYVIKSVVFICSELCGVSEYVHVVLVLVKKHVFMVATHETQRWIEMV